MKSMGRYVHRRITTPEGKAAYLHAMRQAITFTTSGFESLELIKARIEGIRSESEYKYPQKLFKKRLEERRCHDLAVDQALEIVSSIEKRFVTGQSDTSPRGYVGVGYVYQEDPNLL